MISWLNRNGLSWQTVPMTESQQKEIKALYKKRLKLYYLLIPSLFVVCFEAFGMVFRKIKRSLTYEYGTLEHFELYYISLCFILYLLLCFIAYKASVYPLRKDYKKGMLLNYKVQVIGKQYFEHVGKYFLVLGALPPYNKTQVTEEQYGQAETGDWIELFVTPHTTYFFDQFGKYYLL